MDEPLDPERSETERTLWHTLDEAGWSDREIQDVFADYRNEILRKAAEKIREAADEVNYGDAAAEARHAFANEFADLIDPNA